MAYRSRAAGEEDYDAFRIQSVAEGGQLPEEVREDLDDLVDAVLPALGEDPDGVVGLRFGKRVIVAPVDEPSAAVDVVDVDLARRVILTVGGRDPGRHGALLAQVLLLRTDAVVGYARAETDKGPSLGVMEKLLVPLQSGPAARAGGAGTVAIGMQATEVASALGELPEDEGGERPDT